VTDDRLDAPPSSEGPSATHRATARSRDEAGRPRNDRPRDALGRPLPRGVTGVPAVPDDLQLDAGETDALARRLWDEGRPFSAHEVFEAAWKNTGDPTAKRLWRGLAQLLVAVTHAMRGNRAGAVALFTRSDETLAEVDAAGAPVDLSWWHEVTAAWRTPQDQ